MTEDKRVQCKLGNETVTFMDADHAAICLAWMMPYDQWTLHAERMGVRYVISHYHALRMIGKGAAKVAFIQAKTSSGRSLYNHLPANIKKVLV
jgi:hypothetical protein